jgi:hypothetical protein
MATLPVVIAETTPDGETVATVGVRLRQATTRPGIRFPSASKTVAVNGTVAPTTIMVCGVVTATATGT